MADINKNIKITWLSDDAKFTQQIKNIQNSLEAIKKFGNDFEFNINEKTMGNINSVFTSISKLTTEIKTINESPLTINADTKGLDSLITKLTSITEMIDKVNKSGVSLKGSQTGGQTTNTKTTTNGQPSVKMNGQVQRKGFVTDTIETGENYTRIRQSNLSGDKIVTTHREKKDENGVPYISTSRKITENIGGRVNQINIPSQLQNLSDYINGQTAELSEVAKGISSTIDNTKYQLDSIKITEDSKGKAHKLIVGLRDVENNLTSVMTAVKNSQGVLQVTNFGDNYKFPVIKEKDLTKTYQYIADYLGSGKRVYDIQRGLANVVAENSPYMQVGDVKNTTDKFGLEQLSFRMKDTVSNFEYLVKAQQDLDGILKVTDWQRTFKQPQSKQLNLDGQLSVLTKNINGSTKSIVDIQKSFDKMLDGTDYTLKNIESTTRVTGADSLRATIQNVTDSTLHSIDIVKDVNGLARVVSHDIKEVDSVDDINTDFSRNNIGLTSDMSITKASDRIGAFLNERFGGYTSLSTNEKAGTITAKFVDTEGLEQTVEWAKQLNGEFLNTNVSTKQAQSSMETFFSATKNELKGIAGLFSKFFLGQQLYNYFQQGIDQIRELDKAFTELNKVSNDSITALNAFIERSFEQSQKIGVTATDLQNSAADFLRLGYNLEDASQLAEITSVYKNVADTDIETASQQMISAIKAFSDLYGGDDIAAARNLADIYNEIGNNFAITSEGIGDALQRSAASLVVANNSVAESVGMITAANSIVQNPERVGAALNVLSMRLRGAKAELEEIGEDTEGVVESTSKLRETILGFSGVDIMKDSSTFKSTAEIMRELGNVFESLSDVNKAGLLETIAGKNRAPIVAALLQNVETMDEVIQAANNANGSATVENEKMLESIEGHINILTSKWQDFWHNTMNREQINQVLDFAAGILDITKGLGAVGTLAVGTILTKDIMALSNPKTKTQIIELFKSIQTGSVSAGTAVSKLFNSAPIEWTTLAVMGFIAAVDAVGTTTEEHLQKAQDAYAEYNSIQSDLTNLQNSLTANEEQISKLRMQGSLTIIDQGELDKLNNANELLRQQISLKEQASDNKLRTAASESADALLSNQYTTRAGLMAKYDVATGNESILTPLYQFQNWLESNLHMGINGVNAINISDAIQDYGFRYRTATDTITRDNYLGYLTDIQEQLSNALAQITLDDGSILKGYENAAKQYNQYLDLISKQTMSQSQLNALRVDNYLSANPRSAERENFIKSTFGAYQNVASTQTVEDVQKGVDFLSKLYEETALRNILIAMQNGDFSSIGQEIENGAEIEKLAEEFGLNIVDFLRSYIDLTKDTFNKQQAEIKSQIENVITSTSGWNDEARKNYENAQKEADADYRRRVQFYVATATEEDYVNGRLKVPDIQRQTVSYPVEALTADALQRLADNLNISTEEELNRFKAAVESVDFSNGSSFIWNVGLVKQAYNDLAKTAEETAVAAKVLEETKGALESVTKAYSELISIQESYSESGALTVNQLYTLLSNYPEYLQYLVDEEGHINLDTEALQNLTKARLNDYIISLDSQRLETVDKWTAEKKAIDDTTESLKAYNNEYKESYLNRLRSAVEEKGKQFDWSDERIQSEYEALRRDTLAEWSLVDNTNIASPGGTTSQRNTNTETGGRTPRSPKAYKQNTTAYDYVATWIKDVESTISEFEDGIKKLNTDIVEAISRGEFDLAEKLQQDRAEKSGGLKDFLSMSAIEARNRIQSSMSELSQIDSRYSGWSAGDLTESNLLAEKQRLDNLKLQYENQGIDAENSGLSTDEFTESAAAVERQANAIDNLYSSVKELNTLVGSSNGMGEWAEKYAEIVKEDAEILDEIYEAYSKYYEAKLGLLKMDNVDDLGEAIDAQHHLMAIAHSNAEALRAMGVSENDERIFAQQSNWQQARESIAESINNFYSNSTSLNNTLSGLSSNPEEQRKYIEQNMQAAHIAAQRARAEFGEDVKYIGQYQQDYQDYVKQLIDTDSELWNRRLEIYNNTADRISHLQNMLDSENPNYYKQSQALLVEGSKNLIAENDKLIEQRDSLVESYKDCGFASAEVADEYNNLTRTIWSNTEALQDNIDKIKESYNERIDIANGIHSELQKAYEDYWNRLKENTENEVSLQQEAIDKRRDSLDDLLDYYEKKWELEDKDNDRQDRIKDRLELVEQRDEIMSAAASGDLEAISKLEDINKDIADLDDEIQDEAIENYRDAMREGINDAKAELEKQSELLQQGVDAITKQADEAQRNSATWAENIMSQYGYNGEFNLNGSTYTIGSLIAEMLQNDNSNLSVVDQRSLNDLQNQANTISTNGAFNATSLDWETNQNELNEDIVPLTKQLAEDLSLNTSLVTVDEMVEKLNLTEMPSLINSQNELLNNLEKMIASNEIGGLHIAGNLINVEGSVTSETMPELRTIGNGIIQTIGRQLSASGVVNRIK